MITNGRSISRRTFLKTTAGAALGAALPSLFYNPAFGNTRRPVREFHFTAAKTSVNLGEGSDFVAWTYNGQVPGPEIRVKEGEIIRVVLKNNLPDGTTIHWHGIPLQNAMDGVPAITQSAVSPGDTFIYEFEARPAGTFLYHSHAGYQLDQGLYGSLIIEPLKQEASYDREYTLVLEDWVMRDNGGTADTRRRPPQNMMHGRMGRRRSPGPSEGPLWEPIYDGYAVNGRVNAAIDPIIVRKNDKVKLRLINASSATIYFLRLAGHTLTITQTDGNPIRPVDTKVIRIGMGERYDVTFVADNPGSWILGAYDSGFGEGQMQIPVVYEGVNRKEADRPVFHRGLRMADYFDFERLEPSGLSEGSPDRYYNQLLSGGMRSSYWTINGQIYPAADSMVVTRGDRVRLRYSNHSMMPHPMHLHGHFFNVVNSNLPPERWISKDTIILDHMQRIDVEIHADNPGRWFHHCHNLYHMEAGMANLLVYRGNETAGQV